MENGQRKKQSGEKKTPLNTMNHCPKDDAGVRWDLFENASLGGFSDGLLTYRVGAH